MWITVLFETLSKLDACLLKLKEALDELSIIKRELEKLIPAGAANPEAPLWTKEVIPLRTDSGVLLATFYVGEHQALIRMAPDKTFRENVPPFKGWFIEKVLEKMRQKDEAAVTNRTIEDEDAFNYEILYDRDVILGIEVYNINSARIKELKTSIRWTLEKMYEKQQT